MAGRNMWFRKILLFFFLLKISIYWALPCYKKLDWLLTHKLLHYTFGVIFFFLVFCYYDFIGYKSNNYESNKITWYFVISHILGNNFPSILYLVNILMTVISDYWLLDIFFLYKHFTGGIWNEVVCHVNKCLT